VVTHLILPIRYAFFACAATCINLVTQAAGLSLYRGPFKLTVAMMAGTATGLLMKYVLDKRWIFHDPSRGMMGHARKIGFYTCTGVFTTAVFWAMEYGFDALTGDGRWRFLGATLGLGIGYALKYQLDSRYVFGNAAG
jgi:putative flippase GtrA